MQILNSNETNLYQKTKKIVELIREQVGEIHDRFIRSSVFERVKSPS